MAYHRYKHGSGSYYRGRSRSGRYYTRKGCYVATCVYGSYDCPEVWTLRRFRDYSSLNNFRLSGNPVFMRAASINV